MPNLTRCRKDIFLYLSQFVDEKLSFVINQQWMYYIKSNLYYAVCIRPKHVTRLRAHLPSLSPGNTAPFEEMLQRRRAVGNTVSDLTRLGFNLRPHTLETNTLPLDQLTGIDAL